MDREAEVDYTDEVVPVRSHITDGDLIFSWSGTLASIIWDRGPALLNQHLFKVTERPGATRGWLHLALDHAVESLLEKSHGTTMKHVTKGVLEAHKVSLPPLPVQRRIVDLMAHLDNQIANLRLERKAALNFHQASKATLLVAADDWLSGVVDDFIRIRVGFPFKSGLFTESEEDVHLLRGDNIEPGGLRWLRAKRWPVQMLSEVATYLLDAGDVVIAMDRTWISSGLKVAVVSEADLPALLVQRVARLTAKEHLLQELVPFYFDSPQFENLVRHEQTGTSVPHISAKQIGSMQMSIPSDFLEQTRIAKLLSDSRSHVDALESEAAALAHVRRNLLAGLLAGQLAVDEGYDLLLDGVA